MSWWSGARRTWLAYFSVAFWYGGGQSIRPGATILIVMPLVTAWYAPGLSKSFTWAALLALITSPGFTCASAGAAIASMKIGASIAARTRTIIAVRGADPIDFFIVRLLRAGRFADESGRICCSGTSLP